MARITETLSQLDLGCPSTLPNALFHWSFLWTEAKRDMRATRSIPRIVSMYSVNGRSVARRFFRHKIDQAQCVLMISLWIIFVPLTSS